MPSSKKRSCRNMSDSDDDSDDDLLPSVFGTSRASKRKSAKDEAAKKKKRMAQMNALLDNGKVKLERENRMDKLCQENNDMMLDESLDRKKIDKNNGNDEGKSSSDATSSLSLKQQQRQEYQPRDAKETSCLGARSTLQFSRVISIQQKSDDASADGNDTEPCGFKPCWSGLEDALIDFRTILLADRQNHQQLSSFTSIRDELLKLCSSKSPYACRTYLRKRLLCKQEGQERVRRIPVNVLRWLMALACGPVTNGCANGDSSNNQKKTEKTHGKQNKKQAARRSQHLTKKENCSRTTTDRITSQRLLMEAQLGAYQTLDRLWSQDLGFPLQQQQQSEIYLLSIAALPQQLCQWFGSSFSFDTASGSNETNREQNDNKDPLHVTSSHTTLVRFLQLWALVLQKQNSNDTIGKNVHLVQFHYDKENRAGLRNHVSDAIMAVLWAGLNPSFASSRSAKNDGNRAIQTIVACLLDRVRLADASNNDGNGDVDNSESFRHWLQTLSDQICTIWSKQLGRGQKGTDAYEDEHAWLCLARSVARLVRIDSDDYKNVGGSHGGLKDHDSRERTNESPLKDFQLSLCRSILKRAFAVDQDGHQLQDKIKREEKINNGDGKSDDWVSRFVDEEMRRMNVPFEIRVSQRWQAMTLAVVGLTKLASSFPEDEASKCFALMDIFTVCFQSTIVELEHEIQKNSLKEKKDGSDDNDDNQITNGNATTIASRSAEDEVLEKHALYNAFLRLEHVSEVISNKTRVLIMRNICFPWASHMAESLRNYARSQKEQYAPPSVTNRLAPVKQQSTISTFFKNNKPSGKLITN